MPVQYNAQPPQEYLCQLSHGIMNEPVCVQLNGRSVICDLKALQDRFCHDPKFSPLDLRQDLKQAISLWKKEHVMEPIDPAQLGVLIADNSLNRIQPDLLNAYLRYIFAMAKANDVAKCIVMVGKYQKEAPRSFDQLSRPEGLDHLSQCVLQLILSEAGREFDQAQRNPHSDSRELYRNSDYQQSVTDRQLHRGMGVLTYTPAIGSNFNTEANGTIASGKPSGESSQFYSVWPLPAGNGRGPSARGERVTDNYSMASHADRPQSGNPAVDSPSEMQTDGVVAAWKPSDESSQSYIAWTVG